MIYLLLFIILIPINLFAGFGVSGVADPASVSGVATPAGVCGVTSAYGGCDTATNEVGDRTEHANENNMAQYEYDCMLMQADCSGDLELAYLMHYGTTSEAMKVCVYTANDGATDHAPDGSDTKLGCSSGDTLSSAGFTALTGNLTGSVTDESWRWVCVTCNTAGGCSYYYNGSAGSKKLWYNTLGNYDTPPDTLSTTEFEDQAWTGTAGNRGQSVYVRIE